MHSPSVTQLGSGDPQDKVLKPVAYVDSPPDIQLGYGEPYHSYKRYIN